MSENGTGRTRCQRQKTSCTVEGSNYVIDVDTVVMSIGTSPTSHPQHHKGSETNRKGCHVVNEETNQTTREGVYAGGDAVTGAATVILAMGAGKKAAAAIDEYLKTNNLF